MEPFQISLIWQKDKNVWRVKINFMGSYIEQEFPHDQRNIAWEFIQSWLPEEKPEC